MIGIGVMSGSSLDGIDIALVEFVDYKNDWQLLQCESVEMSSLLVEKLSNTPDQNAIQIADTQNCFSVFVADSVIQFRSKLDTALNEKIEFVGVHGHTVLHLIEHNFSWQLINGGYLASTIGLDVVCDFRNQDVALEGQGTPMAVIADRDLYPDYDAYINLGGIANLSKKQNQKWMSYDAFPCNQILNYFSKKVGQPFDKDGLISRTGQVNSELLNALKRQEYLLNPPPKSLDNNWIKNNWLKSMLLHELSSEDFLRTYVEFMAQQIIFEIKSKSKILLTGGGAKNLFLIARLEALNTKIQFVIPKKEIIDFKEAVLIAYASYLRLSMKTNFIADATGAQRDTIGGAHYIGRNKTV